MVRIKAIQKLPANISEFIKEIACGMEGLYGASAGAAYRSAAPKGLELSLALPGVNLYAAKFQRETLALLMTHTENACARIVFMHVLQRYSGRGVEEQLIIQAVKKICKQGAAVIICETIPFCDVDMNTPFQTLGFEYFSRELMMTDLAALIETPTTEAKQPENVTCRAFEQSESSEAAEVIVACYHDNAERRIHTPVRSVENARDMFAKTLSGAYGMCRPEYLRLARIDKETAGVIIGFEAAPEVGFIMQVAVHPKFQNRGIGERLIRGLSQEFLSAGLNRIALGVTLNNPARRLYQRLGFKTIRQVDAFSWWRDES